MVTACLHENQQHLSGHEDSSCPGRPFEGAQARPVRVCVISPLGYGLYHPESGQPFGGAEVQLFLLAHELSADHEFQVSILTTLNRNAGVEQRGRLRLHTRAGGGRLGPKGEGTLRGYVSAFAGMYRTLARIDADVYVHAGAGVEVGAYSLICRLLRRRFIFVVASSEDLAVDPPNLRGPLRWMYPLGLRMADAIVCRTEEQRAALRDRFNIDGGVIRTGHALPSGVPPSHAGKSTILWVGRMHPLKQPQLFLELAARLPKDRFVMVIARDETQTELCAEVRSRAAQLPNLSLEENVPWTDVGHFFGEAKVFVNTSTYEGFPNTFVQAALRGAPILSWKVDPDKVLTQHRVGLCAGGMFERFVEQARDLCDNEPLRLELGRRAVAYARERHDLVRTTDQFKQLFKTVVADRVIE